MSEPLLMDCEGSGCLTHPAVYEGYGTCAMCGSQVPTHADDTAMEHLRKDVLAMLIRGDFG